MSQDLTNSAIQRQNILNNPYALQEIEKAAQIRGIAFEKRARKGARLNYRPPDRMDYGDTLPFTRI